MKYNYSWNDIVDSLLAMTVLFSGLNAMGAIFDKMDSFSAIGWTVATLFCGTTIYFKNKCDK